MRWLLLVALAGCAAHEPVVTPEGARLLEELRARDTRIEVTCLN